MSQFEMWRLVNDQQTDSGKSTVISKTKNAFQISKTTAAQFTYQN